MVLKKKRSLLLLAVLAALGSVTARADVLVSGNAAGFGTGVIGTYNFTQNSFVGSFLPEGAPPGNNGRGLALTLNEFFYTELTGGFGPTDGIRVAPYNGGAGGADIGFFANPIPGTGIQDLAFGAAGLYALVGYPSMTPRVFLLNPSTGQIIGPPGGITLQGTDPGTDGFTVLPDGTFIANLGDAENVYQHFDANGNPIGGTFSVPFAGSSTGVDIAPDGLSLYFSTDFNSITHTDLNGVFIDKINTQGELFEDLAVQQPFSPPPPGTPEPGTYALFASGLAAIAWARRRRKA